MSGYKEFFPYLMMHNLPLKRLKKMGLRLHGTDSGGDVKWQR